jgi:diguanylate cyclase (GGDEF)-like protein
MTGMNNRRAFFSHGKQVEHHAIQYKKTFSVLMIDIDFFKKINDLYGHDIGDQAIIALANCITQNVRKPDISGRLGGEEFAVIVPESDLITSEKLARRIQENVKKIRITTDAGIVSYNISIGVACQSDQFESLDEILKKSDQALYMAKENGRDCIISYHD